MILPELGWANPWRSPTWTLRSRLTTSLGPVSPLTLDPGAQTVNHQSLSSGELAQVYGFTDLDGTSSNIWQRMGDWEGSS